MTEPIKLMADPHGVDVFRGIVLGLGAVLVLMAVVVPLVILAWPRAG